MSTIAHILVLYEKCLLEDDTDMIELLESQYQDEKELENYYQLPDTLAGAYMKMRLNLERS